MTKRKSQPIDIQLVDFLAPWYQRELNQRHTDFQSVALPTELWYPFFALQNYNIFLYTQHFFEKIFFTVISRQLLNLQLSQKGGNSIMTTNDKSIQIICIFVP